MLAKVAQGAANQGEGPLETVRPDELSGRAEGVEENGAVPGVEAGGIIFADAEPAAAAQGAGRGGPVDVLGRITGLPGSDAPQLPGRVSRSGPG